MGWRTVVDAYDVLRHVRSPLELLKAALPGRWLRVHVLNAQPAAGPAPAATEVAVALRRLKNRLSGEALDAAGRVDYAALAGGEHEQALRAAAAQLHAVEPSALSSDEERIAFWLNTYNVLAIHGVIARGITRSVMQIPTFFATTAYRVGPHVFTLDQIENGVLRRNAGHPASGRAPFAPDDPRLAYAPRRLEPRIHMALVCASASCPPVAFFTPEGLEDELSRATAGYLQAEVRAGAAELELPLVFRYYPEDFGDLRAFLLEHAPPALRDELRGASDARVLFRRYDWSLNHV